MNLFVEIMVQFVVSFLLVAALVTYPLSAGLLRLFQLGIRREHRFTLFELLTALAKVGGPI